MTHDEIIELNQQLKESIVNLAKQFEEATGFAPKIHCEKVLLQSNGVRYWTATADIHIDNNPFNSK
jgi:hypothetical protein